jgi:hypothetical protein
MVVSKPDRRNEPVKLKTIALAAARAAAAVPANAMDYSYRLIGRDTVIVDSTGEIGPYEKQTFANWAITLPRGVLIRPNSGIVLNSPGGNPFGAAAFAEALRKAGNNTGVAEGGICASACVIIWAAGVHKSVSASSRIGVHGASFAGANINASNKQMFEGATSRALAVTLREYGAPATVVAAAATTAPEDIYWLTYQDYADWGVNVRP